MTLGESAVVPVLGGTGMGTSSGVGLGAVGGGIVGLLLGGLLGNNGGGLFGGNNNNQPVVAAAATDVLLNPAFQSLQQQINTLSTSLNTGDIQDSIGRVQTQVGQLDSSLAAANFTTLSSINGLGRDIQTQVNATAVQNLQSFNQLGIQNVQGFNAVQTQSQNLATQIINQGVANAAAMASCCCEIKGLIAADGNQTRALINDLNVQNLRDQLAAANNKVSNNDQNQYLLSTILAHIKPTTVVS